MTQQIEGQLEIDTNRGVIYFHGNDGRTRLRICRLPEWTGISPIDGGADLKGADFIDITAPERVSYSKNQLREEAGR